MAVRTLKLEVVKADGTREDYVYTKVMGTIANALCAAGRPDVAAAEELAEAVTFFLYHTGRQRLIGAGEIFSIIKTVLAGTGFEEAAAILNEHYFERKLRRSRIEVIREKGSRAFSRQEQALTRWDKTRIIEDLVAEQGLDRQTARAVASMVEEKVLNIGLSLIPVELVRQLVLNDTAIVLHAKQQLQAV
jgi:hypothetical protein